MKEEIKKKLVWEILEVFENFLDSKGINIPNDEKDGNDNVAILYGTDYGNLEDDVTYLINTAIDMDK